MKHYLFACMLGIASMSLVACSTGPRVTMDAFTPEEISVLTYAAAATYAMNKQVSPTTADSIVAYLEVMRSSVTTGELNLLHLRAELIDDVPHEWQPLAEATWVILLKRIHIEQLIADGEYAEARAYINAALDGVIRAFQRQGK